MPKMLRYLQNIAQKHCQTVVLLAKHVRMFRGRITLIWRNEHSVAKC